MDQNAVPDQNGNTIGYGRPAPFNPNQIEIFDKDWNRGIKMQPHDRKR